MRKDTEGIQSGDEVLPDKREAQGIAIRIPHGDFL